MNSKKNCKSMYSVFSTNSSTSGYRLQYMEVLNWGTFHNKIFRMEPRGNNALLTGANASGKSTIIDALLTLMVPAQKDRFYNQSSGVEKKGNRTEETYVLGNYGSIQHEGESGSTMQSLRDKGTYSILLASFANTDMHVVTLFQVRWFAGGELKRTFGIAHKALEIGRDFANFDGKGNWRKQLDKAHRSNTRSMIEFFEGPMGYADRLTQLLGMRSLKALGLFNQIVGVKVLDDLDEFIRTNMLEDQNAESQYIQLKDSFKVLMDAQNNIEKTKLQIEKLTPIVRMADEICVAKNRIDQLDADLESIDFWFASRTIELGEEKIKRYSAELANCEKENHKLEETMETLREEERNKQMAVENDEVGRQIKEIEKDIQGLEKQSREKEKQMEEYNRLANELELQCEPDKEIFDLQRRKTGEGLVQLKQEEEDLIKRMVKMEQEQHDTERGIKEHVETIEAMLKNKNNIPVNESRIRDMILEHTGATKEEIPFIGELIRVSESEMEWEGAIEKILHNFALHLVVPHRYYHEVNELVNSTPLKGRITYYHYLDYSSIARMQSFVESGNRVLDKIETRQDSEYEEWVRDTIANKYNYTCVDSVDELEGMKEKAVTRNGLIKFAHERHEKDDRAHVASRQNYILGWDNTDKIDILVGEMKELEEKKEALAEEMVKLRNNKDALQKRVKNSDLIVEKFTDYDQVDWHVFAHGIEEKKVQKAELESQNEAINALKKQIEQIKKDIQKTSRNKDANLKNAGQIEIRLRQVQANVKGSQERILALKTLVLDDFENNHQELKECAYEDLNKEREVFKAKVAGERKRSEQELNTNQRKATSLLGQFKRPADEVLDKYKTWRADVSALPESVEMIEEYQDMLARLEREDLPKHEKDFNEYLERTLTDKVGDFRMFFVNWRDSIDESIRMLNNALKDLDYHKTPVTYIKLVKQNRPNEAIKEFRQLMKEAMPNVHQMDLTIDGRRLHFYEHIVPFMERLENENWREEVMNVRSWYNYKVEEFNRETGIKENTYEGMGHLSGGEKAQLTYTILGSAIAYQFGIAQRGMQENSFRFIAIDEAFKAQDEEKARYLLELCDQLHLQLLVVTPNDNINIVENDISFVYYVERKQNKTSWLYSMPIEQWKGGLVESVSV